MIALPSSCCPSTRGQRRTSSMWSSTTWTRCWARPFPQTTAATPLPKTRRLLVDEGATFSNAFAHVPICNPSRAATLTGKYFHNLRTVDNTHTPTHVDMAKVHDHTFALDFQRAGYATGLFGKYANAMPEGGTVPRGWDAWFANDGGKYFDPSFWIRNVPGVPDGRHQMEGYSTSLIGNASLAFLDRELAAARRAALRGAEGGATAVHGLSEELCRAVAT